MLSFLKQIGWLRLFCIGTVAALVVAYMVFGLDLFGPGQDKLQRLILIGLSAFLALLVLVAAIVACFVGWQHHISKRALNDACASLQEVMEQTKSPEAERARRLLRERAAKDC